jgi:hypothetical protein
MENMYNCFIEITQERCSSKRQSVEPSWNFLLCMPVHCPAENKYAHCFVLQLICLEEDVANFCFQHVLYIIPNL